VKAHQAFFFLLLALIPTQLGYHFWPAWAHVLGRRVDYLSPTLFFTDLLLLATVAAYLWQERPKVRIKNLATPLVVVAFVAANIFFAVSPYVAILKWGKAVELALLFWYIVKTAPTFFQVAFPLALGVLYSSLLALGQFAVQRSLGLWILGERTFTAATPGIARSAPWGREILRPYASFPHPNVLGGFMAVSLPVILAALSQNMKTIQQTSIQKLHEKKTTIIYLAAFFLGAAALLLTFSRSAIAVGVVAAASWYLILKKQTRWFVAFGVAAVALFIFVFPISVEEESVVVRGALNSSALALFSSSPIVGVGLGNFLVRLPEALPSRQIYFLQPAHNIYLLLLAETGILGVGLIALALARFAAAKKILLRTPRSPFVISLLVLLLLGLVDHYPTSLQQGQLLNTLFAALVVTRVLNSSKDEQ
jgi:O-antigen ligase